MSAHLIAFAGEVGVVARFVAGAATVLAIFYGLFVWNGSGRGRVKSDEYVREPPDESPPAVVALLFAETPGYPGITATLLDLVRRGVMSEEGTLAGSPVICCSATTPFWPLDATGAASLVRSSAGSSIWCSVTDSVRSQWATCGTGGRRTDPT